MYDCMIWCVWTEDDVCQKCINDVLNTAPIKNKKEKLAELGASAKTLSGIDVMSQVHGPRL